MRSLKQETNDICFDPWNKRNKKPDIKTALYGALSHFLAISGINAGQILKNLEALFDKFSEESTSIEEFLRKSERFIISYLEDQFQLITPDVKKLIFRLTPNATNHPDSRSIIDTGVKAAFEIFKIFAKISIRNTPNSKSPRETFLNSYPEIFDIAYNNSATFLSILGTLIRKGEILPEEYFYIHTEENGKLRVRFNKPKFLQYLRENQPKDYKEILESEKYIHGCPATRIRVAIKEKTDVSTSPKAKNIILIITNLISRGIPSSTTTSSNPKSDQT